MNLHERKPQGQQLVKPIVPVEPRIWHFPADRTEALQQAARRYSLAMTELMTQHEAAQLKLYRAYQQELALAHQFYERDERTA